MAFKNLKRNISKAIQEPAYALRVLHKRALSWLSYFLSYGLSPWPETVSLFLTYQCNLKCSMCGYWGRCGSLKNASTAELKEILSLDDLKKLVDELAGFRPNITLFGGEPFLYPAWPELVSYIKKKKMRANVVTNSTLLFGKEEELIDSGIDEIIFSLEGPQEIHDKITNISGTFDKAFSAIRKIGELEKERGLKHPLINIAVTISEDNYKLLFETFKVALRLEPNNITFHHLSFVDKHSIDETNAILKRYFGATTRDWAGFLYSDLPKINTDILVAEMNKIKKSADAAAVFFYPDFSLQELRQYYRDFNFKSCEYKNRCLSPWMTVYIFPDGSVGPCEELNLYFGNIKEHSFKEIWNNQAFRRFRRILKSERCFPVCSRCTELYRF